MEDVLQRYFNMERSGIKAYFDTDEICELLEYFEFMEDYDHYKKVVKLGQKLHPFNIDIKIQLCRYHLMNEEYENALALIEKIGDAEDMDVIFIKWECLIALDRYDEVIAHIEVLKINPDEELQEMFEFFAPILNENYNHTYALDFIKRGLAQFPNSLLLKEELCLLLEGQGRIEEALSVCTELIDDQPFSIDYRYIQGRLYAVMEAYDKAIESFDQILIFDEEDIEIHIMKAYCFIMNEQYTSMVDLYFSEFGEEIEHLKKTVDHVDIAYIFLRQMMEEFKIDYEFSPKGIKALPSCMIENDEGVNGFTLMADSFPGSIAFFFLKELLLLAKGELSAIQNIEQLLEIVYQKGTDNAHIRIDTVNTSCLSQLKQKADNYLDAKKPGIDCNENDLNTVRQIICHILNRNISRFCKQYEDLTPHMISKCFEKIFLPVEKHRQRRAKRLSNDFLPAVFDSIPSNELATRYLNDKNHNN